jgi:hypothetical protein
MISEIPLPYQDFVNNTNKQQLLLNQIRQFNNNETSEVILKEQNDENQQIEPQYSTIYGLPNCDTVELDYNIETNILKITIYRDTQCEQSLPEKNKTYVPILLINDYKIIRVI